MTNDECRMTKEIRSTNDEPMAKLDSGFGLGHSFVILNSPFVIF